MSHCTTLTGPLTHTGVNVFQQISNVAIKGIPTYSSHFKSISVSDTTCALKFWGGPGGAKEKQRHYSYPSLLDRC